MNRRDAPSQVEFLQGTLDLLILRTLLTGSSHGHAIARHIQRTSEELLQVETGSLYPGIALHCINNSVAMASGEGWSWQVPVVLVVAPLCCALLIWVGLRIWPDPKSSGPAQVIADAPSR